MQSQLNKKMAKEENALDKLKTDSTVASGPLITTINDLVAVVTYYGLAWILLINVMGL